MRILGSGTNPPVEPISGKTVIKVCSKCAAVLEFTYEDMWVKHKLGHELNFITCPSCNNGMPVSEVQRDEMSRGNKPS